MARLSSHQWEAIYEGSLRVLRADTIEAFAQESLGCLAALIPAKQYMLFTFTNYAPGAIEFGPVYTYGSNVHYLDAFMDGSYLDEDRLFSRMNLKVADCAYRDSDIIDEEKLVQLRVYKDIYQRDGVHYGMRVNMVVNNMLAGSYSVFRSKEEGDYTDQEMDICNKLAALFSVRFNQLVKVGKGQKQSGLSRIEAMDHFGLTAREYQVAEMVAKGYSDEEVGDALSVSPATARKHLYNAYAKLAVNKRSQLEEVFGYR